MPWILGLGLAGLAALMGMASRGGGRRRTRPVGTAPTPVEEAASSAASRVQAQEGTAEDFEALAAHAADMGEDESAAAFMGAAAAAPEEVTVDEMESPETLPPSPPPALPPSVPEPDEVEEEEVDEPADMSFSLEEAEGDAPPTGFNPEGAAALARSVQSDLSRRHNRFSRTQMRDFQTAAGITVDGLYGGQTRGALVFFDVPDAHATISRPRATTPYMWEWYIRSTSGE